MAGGALDGGAYASFRARLLRHIGIEEKVVYAAAREARGGLPILRAPRLRRDHAAISTLLVPTPDLALAREVKSLLEPHSRVEEGEGGAYEECCWWLSRAIPDVLARVRGFPPVRLAPYADGPMTVRTAAEALARADRVRPPAQR